jgi:hypothetical protein
LHALARTRRYRLPDQRSIGARRVGLEARQVVFESFKKRYNGGGGDTLPCRTGAWRHVGAGTQTVMAGMRGAWRLGDPVRHGRDTSRSSISRMIAGRYYT